MTREYVHWAPSSFSTSSWTTTTATRRGVTLTEIETLLYAATQFRRDKRSGASDYVAVGNRIRVNFLYRHAERTARPISAWRLR